MGIIIVSFLFLGFFVFYAALAKNLKRRIYARIGAIIFSAITTIIMLTSDQIPESRHIVFLLIIIIAEIFLLVDNLKEMKRKESTKNACTEV